MKTITVKVKSKELKVTNKVKTYYYKDCNGKEVLIGSQNAMNKFHLGKTADECHIDVYSKWTKARRFKTKLHKIIIDNVKLEGIQSQINNIMTKVNGYAYKYSINNESGPLCQ